MRSEFASEPGGYSRWALGDSSPQAGRDWFQCKETIVKNSDLLKVAHAIDTLTSDYEAAAAGDRFAVADMRPHNNTLATCIKQHMKAPMAKGQGCSSVEHLASCFVQSCYLEVDNLDELHRVLREYVSFTSDLGTDSGIRSFRVSSAEDVLPEWLQCPKVELEPDLTVQAQLPPPPPPALEPVLPTAIDVQGALHILSNLPKDIENKLSLCRRVWVKVRGIGFELERDGAPSVQQCGG